MLRSLYKRGSKPSHDKKLRREILLKIRTLVGNGIVAALYIAVSAVVQPFGFTNVQFRISEMFNHLIVFNKNYFYGIVLGVFLTNLFFSPLVAFDLVFGVGHTVISLLITISAGRYFKNK